MGKIYLPAPIGKDGTEIEIDPRKLAINVPATNEAELGRYQTVLTHMYRFTMKEQIADFQQNQNGRHEISQDKYLSKVASMHNDIVCSSMEQKEAVEGLIAESMGELDNLKTHPEGFVAAYAALSEECAALEAYEYHAQVAEMDRQTMEGLEGNQIDTNLGKAVEDQGLSL